MINIDSTGINFDLLYWVSVSDMEGSIESEPRDINRMYKKLSYLLRWGKEVRNIAKDIYSDDFYTLMNPEYAMKPYGIMLIGLPGSGKNTFIKRMLHSDTNKYRFISRDDIRCELGIMKDTEKKIGTDKEEKEVTRIEYERIKLAIEQQYIPVLNSTNLSLKKREAIKHINGIENMQWKYIYIQPKVLAHNKKRRRNEMAPEVIDKMIPNIDFPRPNEYNDFKVYIAEGGAFKEYYFNIH